MYVNVNSRLIKKTLLCWRISKIKHNEISTRGKDYAARITEMRAHAEANVRATYDDDVNGRLIDGRRQRQW